MLTSSHLLCISVCWATHATSSSDADSFRDLPTPSCYSTSRWSYHHLKTTHCCWALPHMYSLNIHLEMLNMALDFKCHKQICTPISIEFFWRLVTNPRSFYYALFWLKSGILSLLCTKSVQKTLIFPNKYYIYDFIGWNHWNNIVN